MDNIYIELIQKSSVLCSSMMCVDSSNSDYCHAIDSCHMHSHTVSAICTNARAAYLRESK